MANIKASTIVKLFTENVHISLFENERISVSADTNYCKKLISDKDIRFDAKVKRIDLSIKGIVEPSAEIAIYT